MDTRTIRQQFSWQAACSLFCVVAAILWNRWLVGLLSPAQRPSIVEKLKLSLQGINLEGIEACLHLRYLRSRLRMWTPCCNNFRNVAFDAEQKISIKVKIVTKILSHWMVALWIAHMTKAMDGILWLVSVENNFSRVMKNTDVSRGWIPGNRELMVIRIISAPVKTLEFIPGLKNLVSPHFTSSHDHHLRLHIA